MYNISGMTPAIKIEDHKYKSKMINKASEMKKWIVADALCYIDLQAKY